MQIKTVIEVESFGDFDVIRTECVMVSFEKLIVKTVVKDYCELRGLDSLSGLPENMINDTRDDFIKYLKGIGFFILKTKKVCISD